MMKIKRIQIVCVAGSVVLYGMLTVLGAGGGAVKEGRYLARNPHGEGDATYEVIVEGLEDEKTAMKIDVGELDYTEEVFQEIVGEIMGTMEGRIRAANVSLSEVRSDLKLPTWIPEHGIRVRWTSEDPDTLDSFGKVDSGGVGNDGKEVWLTAGFSDGFHEASYEIPVRIYPAALTGKEAAAQGLREEIKRLDEEHRYEDALTLPLEYGGKELRYREDASAHYEVLLVLGVVLAVVCSAKDEVEARSHRKERNRQLMLDYSEVVSKLMVFIGAGMTIRSAWEKIAYDYEAMRREGSRQPRCAYEEMYQTCCQMKSGTSEGQAYQNFGRRCQLQPYMKLGSLLEQNRREGTKNLRTLLRLEMIDAFEQRKNLARKMGEEAGTKLLLPLFLMLSVVMVMIMVPALLSFY